MDSLLAAADLAVCRSGGTTVAELAVVGVPSVLVPFPMAPRDHQTANAEPMVRGGRRRVGARRRPRHRPTRGRDGPAAWTTIGRLAEMATAVEALARPDAADGWRRWWSGWRRVGLE